MVNTVSIRYQCIVVSLQEAVRVLGTPAKAEVIHDDRMRTEFSGSVYPHVAIIRTRDPIAVIIEVLPHLYGSFIRMYDVTLLHDLDHSIPYLLEVILCSRVYPVAQNRGRDVNVIPIHFLPDPVNGHSIHKLHVNNK